MNWLTKVRIEIIGYGFSPWHACLLSLLFCVLASARMLYKVSRQRLWLFIVGENCPKQQELSSAQGAIKRFEGRTKLPSRFLAFLLP